MKKLLLIALCLLFQNQALAQEKGELQATTLDGRLVRLNEDHTWAFIPREVGDPSNSAVLTVTEMEEMQDACRFQFKLKNNLGYRISSLVPRLAVHNKDGIIFDEHSLSFTSIKPTKSKYTDIQFTGIGCHQMSLLKVIDASRCRMGDIDQWNEEDGQCLSHLYVEPSDLINISK